MNKRTRRNRQSLRDHRRNPWLGYHTIWDSSRPSFLFPRYWVCPRCPLGKGWASELVDGQWRLEKLAKETSGD